MINLYTDIYDILQYAIPISYVLTCYEQVQLELSGQESSGLKGLRLAIFAILI